VQITINLSRANIPLAKLAPFAGRLQSMLASPTVTVSLEIGAGKLRIVELKTMCEELKIPYTVFTPSGD